IFHDGKTFLIYSQCLDISYNNELVFNSYIITTNIIINFNTIFRYPYLSKMRRHERSKKA
ncbi:MAG: hypothetical protein ACFFHD_11970, partial [Promethearchaeota archaeon]